MRQNSTTPALPKEEEEVMPDIPQPVQRKNRRISGKKSDAEIEEEWVRALGAAICSSELGLDVDLEGAGAQSSGMAGSSTDIDPELGSSRRGGARASVPRPVDVETQVEVQGKAVSSSGQQRRRVGSGDGEIISQGAFVVDECKPKADGA